MKKYITILLITVIFSGCQMQQIIDANTEIAVGGLPSAGGFKISAGLKEALNNGITKQVSRFTVANGFYGNEAVKILLPPELQKVDTMLRSIDLSALANEGIISINSAAEVAVKTATPIFLQAINNIIINDARTILFGSENVATNYLLNGISSSLNQSFSPIVKQSIGKAGADMAWNKIIIRYNAISLITKVNPNLVDYVTQKNVRWCV